MIQDWRDLRVTVMGLGGFGGGVGVARWLIRQGARVTVTDKAPAEKLRGSLDQLADLSVTLHLGGHDTQDFQRTDLVVVNPAVPDSSEFLNVARDAGVPITTEINLFVERCPAPCIGITGSVGKSTITAMTGHLLTRTAPASARQVWVGGNIGRSLLDDVAAMTADDIVVLELSSFQLARTPAVQWSPHVAVLTNLAPNHLDWHGSFDAYQAAKLNIARYQDPQRDVLIAGESVPLDSAAAATTPDRPRRTWRFGLDGDTPTATDGDRRLRWDGLQLAVPGGHNRENAAAALTVAHCLGVAPSAAVRALATFEALPHRLQRVGNFDGVAYYDDSKSTTPQAAITALRSFDRPILVILGGYDKGSDLRPVAQEAARRARFAACIGKTGPALCAAIQAAGGVAELCGDLPAAVAACRARARTGDVVLLSPACASWDQFIDFRQRGLQFARLVRGESA